MTNKQTIDEFFSSEVFALAGASSKNNEKFGNYILKEMTAKSLKVFPLHPYTESIDGMACYKDFAEMPQKPKALIISVPKGKSDELITKAAKSDIKYIWFQQGAGSATAYKKCDELGIKYIAGECVMMFLEPVTSIHKFHRLIWKLIGKYPK